MRTQTSRSGATRSAPRSLADLTALYERALGPAITEPVARRRVLGVSRTEMQRIVARGDLRPIGRRGGPRGRRVFLVRDVVAYLVGGAP